MIRFAKACLNSVLLLSLNDVYEERHVNAVDIIGAFIKTQIKDNKNIILKMNGGLEKLLAF
jgi:hypothetical protein